MQSISPWRFWIPLVCQAALILGVPAQSMYTFFVGKTVILQTLPVDPYDPLRGYYQTLRYDISQFAILETLPGWETTMTQEGTRIFVLLEIPQGASPELGYPPPWNPIAISRDRPENLPSSRISIQGTVNNGFVDYGLEKYYMAEDQREMINEQIRQTFNNSGEEPPFVVEVKVDSQGNAVAESLWISDRNYRF